MHAVLTKDEIQHDVVLQTEALTSTYDSANHCVWMYCHAEPRPCVTETLLDDLSVVHQMISNREIDADFYVLASAVPKVFSLGGDLSLFRHCVENQDWERLLHYATSCIDVLYGPISGFKQQVISIAMVEGDALGGGFEGALAMDFIMAERGAKFGFPEVLFNLFPGMGAYSMLARKMSPQIAQRMILSGEFYQAEELHVKGLVDTLIEPGYALREVEGFMRDTRKQLRGYKSFLEARRTSALWPRKEELMQIVHQWVDSVKQVTPRDLKLMDKLVMAQNRLKVLAAA